MSKQEIVPKEDISKDAVHEIDDQVLEKLVEEYELSEKEEPDELDEKEDVDELEEEDEAVEEVKINQDQKVITQKKHEEMAENEIKITSKGQIKNYLGYAFRIFNKTDHRSLKIRATGNAIVKALILIELVKRRVPDLHQLNKIYSIELKSTKEPQVQESQSKKPEDKQLENEEKEKIRRVAAMDTILSKEKLDKNQPGYQEPLNKEEVIQIIKEKTKQQNQHQPITKKENQKKGQRRFNDFNDDKEQKPQVENKVKKQNENGEKIKAERGADKDKKQERPKTVHRLQDRQKLDKFEVEQVPKQASKQVQNDKNKEQNKDQPKDKEQPKQKGEKKGKNFRNNSEERVKTKFDEPKQKNHEEQKRDQKKGDQKEDFKKQKEDFKKKTQDFKKQNKEEFKKQGGQPRPRKRSLSPENYPKAHMKNELFYSQPQFYGRRGGYEAQNNRPPYYQENHHPEEHYHKQRHYENNLRMQYSHDDFYAIDKPVYYRRGGFKEYYNDRSQFMEQHQMYPPQMGRPQGNAYYSERFDQFPQGQRGYYEQNDRQQRQFQHEHEGMMQGQRLVFYGNNKGEQPGSHGGYYPMDPPRGHLRGGLKHEFIQRGDDRINVPARDREQMNQMHLSEQIPKGQRAEYFRGMRGMGRGMQVGMGQRDYKHQEYYNPVNQSYQEFPKQPRDHKNENERSHQVHQKRRGGEPDNNQGEGKRGSRQYN